MTFPPPDPSQQTTPIGDPAVDPRSSSRRTASIVALTSGLLVGGVLVGSQFVSANNPSVADDPATSSTEVPDTEAPADDSTEPPLDESNPDESNPDESNPDESGPHDAGWMDFDGLFELDPEITAQFEEFDACISDQLGDLDLFGGFDVIGEDGMVPPFEKFDFDIPAGVFVEAGDDTGFYEFGDGDGTITITKSGDDISVSSDGDVNVETFELPDFDGDGDFSLPGLTPELEAELDTKWTEIDAKWQEVEATCGDLLPDDFLGGMFGGLLDGVFSGGPFEIPSDG